MEVFQRLLTYLTHGAHTENEVISKLNFLYSLCILLSVSLQCLGMGRDKESMSTTWTPQVVRWVERAELQDYGFPFLLSLNFYLSRNSGSKCHPVTSQRFSGPTADLHNQKLLVELSKHCWIWEPGDQSSFLVYKTGVLSVSWGCW